MLGALAFVVSRLILPTSPDVLRTLQELGIWTGAAALSWCAIAMLLHRYAQRARLREEQSRKIRIVPQDR
jgi:hypothetical protein